MYRFAGGAPTYVNGWDAFGGPQIYTVIDPAAIDNAGKSGRWSHVLMVPADGTFVSAAGAPFRVAGGAALPISSWAPFGGEQPATVIDPAVIAKAGESGRWSHLRALPSDGTTLATQPSGQTWVVAGGRRYRVASSAVTPVIVNDTSVAGIPLTGPAYHPTSPQRVLDSRKGTGLSGPFEAGQTRNLKVTGVAGVPAAGVTAVVLNVTAVSPSAATFVSVWPKGEPKPTASNLNVPAGDVRANLVVAKVGAGGEISLFNNSGTVHLVADVVGYYDNGTAVGDRFRPATPQRVLDSRKGTGLSGPFEAGQTRNLKVTGVAGVPAVGVTAVVLNVTAVSPSAATFVSVWPKGEPKPTASNLNVPAGDVRANLVVAKVGAGGEISLFNNSGTVHLVADVVGWYTANEATGFNAIGPERVLDSRKGTGLSGPFEAGQTRNLKVTGVAGVPAVGVTAVVLNVTAVSPSAATFVSVWPKGEPKPTASNLNVPAGDVRANLVVAKVGADGEISLFNNSGTVHLVADVVGYHR